MAAEADLPRHGGDLAFARAHYGEPADGWLDLSTGVNPTPYPAPPLAAAALARLPDRDALRDLVATARRAYGAPAQATLIATPGSDTAIRLLPVAAPPGPVVVVAPTYAGHVDAWRDAGRVVVDAATIDAIPDEATIAVVVNPNNPDGQLHHPDALAQAAHRLGERGGLLVVDEAFGDPTPDASLMPYLAGLPAVVLRSFGKFYGLAGLRLGFVAGSPPPLDRLAALLGEWPVSSAAIAIGRAALADAAWRDAARRRLRTQHARLSALLARRGLDPIGGTDLFVLVDTPTAADIHRELARRGIWTRVFVEQPAWLRIGLPGGDAGFTRLDGALEEIIAPAAVR